MTVGGLTGDESEGEQRKELGQADHPDGERGLRERHGRRAISYTSHAMTTAWEPVASVPRNRPARNITYGRRVNSDDESSAGSGARVAAGIQHFPEAEMAETVLNTFIHRTEARNKTSVNPQPVIHVL